MRNHTKPKAQKLYRGGPILLPIQGGTTSHRLTVPPPIGAEIGPPVGLFLLLWGEGSGGGVPAHFWTQNHKKHQFLREKKRCEG